MIKPSSSIRVACGSADSFAICSVSENYSASVICLITVGTQSNNPGTLLCAVSDRHLYLNLHKPSTEIVPASIHRTSWKGRWPSERNSNIHQATYSRSGAATSVPPQNMPLTSFAPLLLLMFSGLK